MRAFPRAAVLAAVAASVAAGPAAAVEFELAQVIVPTAVVLPIGKVQRVTIEVVVKPGYHVQANPPAYPNLIPTTLTLLPAPGVAVGKPVYPRPARKRLQGSGDDLLVYGGRFQILVPMGIYSATALPIRLEGMLRYQGCDDIRCLFPQTLPVAVTLKAAQP